MGYKDFFSKYNNKGIDFDNFYGFQCMDLAEQYNQEVVGAPRLGGNAKDVWNHYPTSFYNKISNTPTGIPQQGDIMIWNAMPGNAYGHIAIFDNGNVNNFVSFDQNWPVGSICHLQNHNYNYILGWLRPKNITPVPPPISDASQKVAHIRDILSSSITDDERITQIKQTVDN